MSTNGNDPGETIYGPRYWEQFATCRGPYRKLGACIAEACEVTKGIDVLEIGCGLAFVLEVLEECGANVLGVDLYGKSATVCVVSKDATKPLDLGHVYDLVICTETGEHVPRDGSDALVDNVVDHAVARILWSAAPPGQDADDPSHINLQPPAFWLEKFAARGWRVDVARTDNLRRFMRVTHAQHEYCADNFHILERAR